MRSSQREYSLSGSAAGAESFGAVAGGQSDSPHRAEIHDGIFVKELQLAEDIAKPTAGSSCARRRDSMYKKNGRAEIDGKMLVENVARGGRPFVHVAAGGDAAVEGSVQRYPGILFLCRGTRTGRSLSDCGTANYCAKEKRNTQKASSIQSLPLCSFFSHLFWSSCPRSRPTSMADYPRSLKPK